MANSEQAEAFIDRIVANAAPMMEASNLAAWKAAVTGDADALEKSAKARAKLKALYSDSDDFETVTALLADADDLDSATYRQLKLLEDAFRAHQLSRETIDDLARRESELEGIFYNFRAVVDGEEASDNELRRLLRLETDSGARRRIWEASKAIGPAIAPKLRELVRRRNEAAREVGFESFYAMELASQEIDEGHLFQILDDFKTRSDQPFRELIDEVNADLAERHGIGAADIRPWHWDDFFAQEAPAIGDIDLDPLFANTDPEQLTREYFNDIGLPASDILERSDLYEREGKDQHAFCIDIDRKGDVRTLCNLRPDEYWTKTLLHELGHGVYDKFLPEELPFLLRTPAHTLTTEAIAMFFGRLTRDPNWLRETLDIQLDPEAASAVEAQQRLSMLVSARWMLVMSHFERALYENPDREDLNKLWWDLVEEFQLIARPEGRDEPDWATKVHFSLAPVYYHNYLLGELTASQFTWAMQRLGVDQAGEFLRERVFSVGATLPWDDVTKSATGAPLSAQAFVDQFVAEPTARG